MKFFGISALLLLSIFAFAQTPPQNDIEEQKRIREAIDAQIEDYTQLLDLQDWQIFYVDSIMTHDYEQMRVELAVLSTAKVSNSEAYIRVQDKWMETMYQAFMKVFDKNQWAKYEKSGAAREKKNRDKREAKRK